MSPKRKGKKKTTTTPQEKKQTPPLKQTKKKKPQTLRKPLCEHGPCCMLKDCLPKRYLLSASVQRDYLRGWWRPAKRPRLGDESQVCHGAGTATAEPCKATCPTRVLCPRHSPTAQRGSCSYWGVGRRGERPERSLPGRHEGVPLAESCSILVRGAKHCRQLHLPHLQAGKLRHGAWALRQSRE